ncbi:hypothetical protein BDY24DRAFT_369746 [Mrakia frigida]|uniref:spermidine synthase n=1 Tax=Mrakia frigida TaxID=29902 RepID=UPI003FCC1EED
MAARWIVCDSELVDSRDRMEERRVGSRQSTVAGLGGSGSSGRGGCQRCCERFPSTRSSQTHIFKGFHQNQDRSSSHDDQHILPRPISMGTPPPFSFNPQRLKLITLPTLLTQFYLHASSPTPLRVPSSILALFILLPLLLSLPLSKPSTPSLYKLHSTTGLIIVGETTIPSGLAYRYLRADHSLLGGRWVVDASSEEWLKSEGMNGLVHGGQDGVGESIFSAFVLQEAARLVERVGGVEEGEEEEALVIGLGVGISSRSLLLHNISTTAVEYDPAVYHAARTYFFLPEPQHVYLEDANAFVQREAAREEGSLKGKFGLVVHDVFSGGAVPGELFTVEFWDDLRVLMKTNGILAINFAGIQKTQAASLVISTLLSTFPACRGFRDALGESQDPEDGALKNMVIFCSAHLPSSRPSKPSSVTSLPPSTLNHQPSSITFRSPVEADYLGSFLRKRVFEEFEQHEVDLCEFGKWEAGGRRSAGARGKKEQRELLWRGEGGKRLEVLQRGSGVATWKAMRELIGVEVWNSW